MNTRRHPWLTRALLDQFVERLAPRIADRRRPAMPAVPAGQFVDWQVCVDSPRFWWRATATNIRRWVTIDPDEEDGRRRWADRDQQRWPLIAAAAAAVGDQLAAGAWTPETDPDNTEDDDDEADEAEDWMAGRGMVTIRVPESLTQTERKIVKSWFHYGEAVRFDPWDESRGVTNGRHRLWGTLPHFNGALVPVVSDALAYANPQDAGTITNWASLYGEDLDQLHEVRWFDAGDPLNQQYVSAMETAARGEFPAEA